MQTLPRSHVVRDERQVRALSGALQHQIVATLERSGAATAKELAAYIGVAPEVLYYHLRKLESVGLLQAAAERPTTRRPERVYALRGRELVLDADNRKPAFLEALAGLQRSTMALATRLYDRAVRSPQSIRRGTRRNLCVIQQYARLRPRDLAELNRRLEAAAEFAAERDDPALEDFISVTISMSPVQREDPGASARK